MNYFERIVRAIKFIERNLMQPIGIEDVAAEACLSKYHFLRFFSGMVGVTPGDYIRKRRLTMASHDLLYTNESILDIALKYHFDSQETFHRSFKNHFDTTPGKYRKEKILQYLHQKQELTVEKIKHLQTSITMEPTIKQVDDFTVVGMTVRTNLVDNKIPMLWEKFIPRVAEIKNKAENNIFYGICKCDPNFDLKKFNKETYFDEIAAVMVSDTGDVPENMIKHQMKGGRFAVFTHKGSLKTLQDTYNYIWGSWVPKSHEKVDMRDDFELYDDRFLGPENESSQMDIYIPLK